MENFLTDIVLPEDLRKFEQLYYQELREGSLSNKTQFDYAWCLVRSQYSADIKKGILILQDLYNSSGEEQKRDCLYFLAIGNAKIKEYNKALDYIRAFLRIEPGNSQVQELEREIKNKMKQEGIKGMAIAGGIVAGIAGVLTLGIAMSKKH